MVSWTPNTDGAGGTKLEAMWCGGLSLFSDFCFVFVSSRGINRRKQVVSVSEFPLAVGCFAFVLTNNNIYAHFLVFS